MSVALLCLAMALDDGAALRSRCDAQRVAPTPIVLAAASQSYVFRIRTKSGGMVGNIVKQGTSQADAERKLRQQYPDCQILDVQVRG